jgi:hypothetical protein
VVDYVSTKRSAYIIRVSRAGEAARACVNFERIKISFIKGLSDSKILRVFDIGFLEFEETGGKNSEASDK